MENKTNSTGQSGNTSSQAGKSSTSSASSQTSNASGQYSGSNQSSDQSQGGLNMESITGMLGGLNIPDALKKYSGSATKAISGLTTTQKVIGGALLVLGATYLTRGSRGGWMKKAGSISKMAMGKNKGNR